MGAMESFQPDKSITRFLPNRADWDQPPQRKRGKRWDRNGRMRIRALDHSEIQAMGELSPLLDGVSQVHLHARTNKDKKI